MAQANAKINFYTNTIVRVIVLASFLIIGAFSLFNRGKGGYSESFLNFSATGAGLGIIITVALILLDLFKNKFRGMSEILTLGHISEDSSLRIINNPIVKVSILVGWAIFLVMLSKTTGLQVWGDPEPYASVSGFSTADGDFAYSQYGFFKTGFDVAFMPAFTEDIMSYSLSIGITMILMLSLWIWYISTKIKFLKPNILWLVGFITIANGISAFYFSRAHELVAGQNLGFYLAAWFFQFINLWVFWLTYFIPLAHFSHNMIYAIGFTISVAFIIPVITRKIWKRFCKKATADEHISIKKQGGGIYVGG